MRIKSTSYAVSLLVLQAIAWPAISYADAISPSVKDRGKLYSKEAPDITMFGTGIGGRKSEASMLRFECERFLQDGKIEKAVLRARKAVQLDPGDTEGHLLLARALDSKLFSAAGPIDEKLLNETLVEWKLIWLHDADQFDQSEAKYHAVKLIRISRALQKRHKQELEARQEAKDQLAKERGNNGRQLAIKEDVLEAPEKEIDKVSREAGNKDSGRESGKESAASSADNPSMQELLSQPHKKKYLLF